MQVGARMEKTLVKVLKGLAEYLDISLGDLLEGVTLHALEGKAPFSKETLANPASIACASSLPSARRRGRPIQLWNARSTAPSSTSVVSCSGGTCEGVIMFVALASR